MLERRWRVGRARPWAVAGLGLAVGLVFLQALLYGGSMPTLSVVFAMLQAMLAMAVVLAPPERRGGAPWPRWLGLPAVLFLALQVWAGFTLTALVPALVAPEWAGADVGAVTIDPAATLHEMVLLGGLACLFFTGQALGRAEGASRRAFQMLAIVGGAFAAWAILSFLSAPGQLFGEDKAFHDGRLTASFLSANTAASVFGGLAALFFTQAAGRLTNDLGATERRLADFALWLAPCVLCLAALLLTASRAGTIAGIVVILLIAAMTLAPKIPGLVRAIFGSRRAIYLAAGGLLALLMFAGVALNALAVGHLWSRVTSDHDAVSRRSAVIQAYADLWLERPLQGYGLGAFQKIAAEHPEAVRTGDDAVPAGVHDVLVQWVLEGGLIGAALMFATIAVILATLIRRVVIGGGPTRLAKGVLAFSAVLLLHDLVDYSLQVPAVAALWALLLGLSAGASYTPLRVFTSADQAVAAAIPIGQLTPVPPMPQ